MFEVVIVPIAIGVLSAAILGIVALYIRLFDINQPRTRKGIMVLFWVLVLVAISILIFKFFVMPTIPVQLDATQTALIAMQTKLESQIEGTRTASTSTAVAETTQIVVQSTETRVALRTQVAGNILQYPQLCSYGTSEKNLSQGESDRNSNLILIVSGLVATVIFLILTANSYAARNKFIGLLFITMLFMAVTGYGIWLYARHPLTSLQLGFYSVDARFEFLSQCQPQNGSRPEETVLFSDLFDNDNNDWRGKNSFFQVDVASGFLNTTFIKKYPKPYFYFTCPTCTVTADAPYYIYNAVIEQDSTMGVSPGFIFTASSFNEKLVNGIGIRLNADGKVIVEKLGSDGGRIYATQNKAFEPKHGFQTIRIDRANNKIRILVNGQPISDSDLTISDEYIGKYFGIYAFMLDTSKINTFSIDKIIISTLQ